MRLTATINGQKRYDFPDMQPYYLAGTLAAWQARRRATLAQPEPWALVTLLERLGAAAPQPAGSGPAELLDALLAVFDDLAEREDDGDGNGPGHSHAVPGIWDPDNGIKAGAVCGWCNKWARAKGLRAAIAKDTAV